MHKQGLICPLLPPMKNTTQIQPGTCSCTVAEQEAEQFQRGSAAALDTDGETTTLSDCPRKERANKKEKYSLEAHVKNKYCVFQKSNQQTLIHKLILDRVQRRAMKMTLQQGSYFTIEVYQLAIRRVDTILVQQSTSNTQLWSFLSTAIYTCITSHTSSEEASSYTEVYNAALDAIVFTVGTK